MYGALVRTALPMTTPWRRRKRRLPTFGVLFGLAIALLLACRESGSPDEEDDNQFRTDVLWCEEALARLASCCPNFDARPLVCDYYYSFDQGCGSSTTRRVEPVFTTDESRCIRNKSCDGLVTEKICEKAQTARAPNLNVSSPSSSGLSSGTTSSTTSTSGFATGGGRTTPPVCQ
jgi:hypothetical protein